MNIYPYVYRLIHKTTGQFYIGVRWANKVPAEQDLGHHYFSSSKVVESIGFEHFDCVVLGVFFDKDAAREHERDLLLSEFGDPLILNRSIPWSTSHTMGHHQPHTPEAKAKMSKAQRGKKKPTITNVCRIGTTHTPETRAKMSKSQKGRVIPLEACKRMSASHTGTKKPWITNEAQKGRVNTPEVRAKMKASWIVRKQKSALQAQERLSSEQTPSV